MSEPKTTEGFGCCIPAQRSTQQCPEMAVVNLEDGSQPLVLNVIVKEEEEEREYNKEMEIKDEVVERAVEEEEKNRALEEQDEEEDNREEDDEVNTDPGMFWCG
ncbi:hypothetical protein UPYG_G00053800 [Umbra pygmaea]|uniref:Uncharacterized protein n=1 Tax=Umbra pygmaea TaxID=75934 RepID=A0ABD0XPU4_UMBPY